MGVRKTAAYKISADRNGNRYSFYCDVSGACVCTTRPYKSDTPQQELETAWQEEGRKYFNRCHKCGKWVIDAAYNPEVCECINCATFETEPRYCKYCGARVKPESRQCPVCGRSLYYQGGD